MIFEGEIKTFIEEEGLKIFKSVQLCCVLQAKVFQRKKREFSV
jgi:hypothetical protein